MPVDTPKEVRVLKTCIARHHHELTGLSHGKGRENTQWARSYGGGPGAAQNA